MATWAVNTSVTFHHGKLERQEVKGHPVFHSAENFVERNNRGGPHHVPGIGLSINFERYVYLQFSHGFKGWIQDRLSQPEVTILRVIDDITDRPNWQVHIYDFTPSMALKDEVSKKYSPWNAKIWEWCVFELWKKAEEFTKNKNGSIFVLDGASRVSKSDRLANQDFFAVLKRNTDSLDLSPWLLPLVFGVSPIRTDGQPITLDNFLDSMTMGVVKRAANKWDSDRLNNGLPALYSGKSQWLATDVKFSEDGIVTIVSPINNLHPVRHKYIYKAVESLLPGLIDDWNQTLLYTALARNVSRITPRDYMCSACSLGDFISCTCSVEFRQNWARTNTQENADKPAQQYRWNPVQALDGAYPSSKQIYDHISLRDGFKDRGLQIYVEISTINVSSDGCVSTAGAHHLSWDLNGNRNERIVATALICLRRDNIEPGSGGISFRSETKRNVWKKKPNPRNKANENVPAGSSSAPGNSAAQSNAPDLENERIPSFQKLGTVQLPEGRIVAYPNALQHKFEPPKLREPNNAGMLQFMQIHLVDPHYVVCSTRFVPPQSVALWKEAVRYDIFRSKSGFPNEITEMIVDHFLVSGFRRKQNKKKRRHENRRQSSNSLVQDTQSEAQPCHPPTSYDSAIRREQEALHTHEKVMTFVNESKSDNRARAYEVWLQSMFGDTEQSSEDEDNAYYPVGNNVMHHDAGAEEDGIDWDEPFSLVPSSSSSSDSGESSDADDDPGAGGEGRGKGKGRAADDEGSGSSAPTGAGTEQDDENCPDPGNTCVETELTATQQVSGPAADEVLESLNEDIVSQDNGLEDDGLVEQQQQGEEEEEEQPQQQQLEEEKGWGGWSWWWMKL